MALRLAKDRCCKRLRYLVVLNHVIITVFTYAMIVHYRLYHTHFLVGNADIITCACTTLIVHYALLHWLLIADTPTGRAAFSS